MVYLKVQLIMMFSPHAQACECHAPHAPTLPLVFQSFITSSAMSCIQFGVKTSSVLICCLYLVFHAAFLVINFVILNKPHAHVEHIVSYLGGGDKFKSLSIYESSNYFIEVQHITMSYKLYQPILGSCFLPNFTNLS